MPSSFAKFTRSIMERAEYVPLLAFEKRGLRIAAGFSLFNFLSDNKGGLKRIIL